ncbi:hypothetical protein BDV24DRAFT_161740 [Aspergillus arachidicola]|uniref:Uncharacterized protein n=1 Tax=Aspergillus arachidicola TaxID=656916 RepID=A0A2G7G3N2_9EURO|nr:hypothetical protein BDV24DRAFT_161740 [Aspergillus arachidicola]PIG87438.1 hypothetical protein AARAC_007436 [Aspergillus arachidicola]
MATPAFDRLREFMYCNGRHDWVLDLPTILQKSGCVDVRLEHFQDPKKLAMANGEQHLMAKGDVAASLRQKDTVEDANNVFQSITDCTQEGSQWRCQCPGGGGGGGGGQEACPPRRSHRFI